jgi:hypothetical protein
VGGGEQKHLNIHYVCIMIMSPEAVLVSVNSHCFVDRFALLTGHLFFQK